MKREKTLRRRLIVAYVLSTVIIGGVFGVAAYVITKAAEYQLIDVRLTRAADRFAADRHVRSTDGRFGDLRILAGAEIPTELQRLAAGVHEIEHQDRVLRLLIVRDVRGAYAVIDDVSDFEQVERIAYTALWVAFFACVLVALAIARATANRVVAPLSVLAALVQRDELSERNALLKATDEIGILARALVTRNDELQQFLTRERLFTADVSHELRTPLTVILGAAEVLSSRLSAVPDLRDTAERIRRTAADSSTRVGALLQLARAPMQDAAGPVELRALVQAEIGRCAPLLQDKPVTCTFDAGQEVWVRAAPELPAIAVSNVLRNACRFTEQGSITVVLTDGTLVIEDTGPGIHGAARQRLFRPFAAGEDGSAGIGLGLSIVKRVAEHLGWTVAFEEAAHGGSRFVFSFRGVAPPLPAVTG